MSNIRQTLLVRVVYPLRKFWRNTRMYGYFHKEKNS